MFAIGSDWEPIGSDWLLLVTLGSIKASFSLFAKERMNSRITSVLVRLDFLQ